VPEVGLSKKLIRCISVDFPLPLGPIIDTNSPFVMVHVALFNACVTTSPVVKALPRFLHSIIEFFSGVSIQPENLYAADAFTPLMNYDEVLFILAEVDNDEAKFREGVKASAMNWGVKRADAEKLANDIDYNGLESIISQKWVANYLQGIQGWSEFRRTGYPELKAPKDGYHPSAKVCNLVVPNRRPYPTDESQLNAENYMEAVNQLVDPTGQQQTKMFWQK